MTPLARKVEAALDRWFRAEGWYVSTDQNGDHIAEHDTAFDDDGPPAINISDCAKAIAEELS